MGIHGQLAANLKLLVHIVGTKKRKSVANPQPTHKPAANPQPTHKPAANPQSTHNYWSVFWTQKNGNPWPTHSQPETIGLHFGHKKAEICGQPAANPQTRKPATCKPAANPQLLVRILDTKKWEFMANPQPT
jgi:hypothetical protein